MTGGHDDTTTPRATPGVPINAREAADRRQGMTLAEVAAWVQDAYRAGIDVDARVQVTTTGWSRGLRRIQAKGQTT